MKKKLTLLLIILIITLIFPGKVLADSYGFDSFQYYWPVVEGEIIDVLDVKNHTAEDSGLLKVEAAKGFYDLFNKNDIGSINKEIVWDDSIISITGSADGKVMLNKNVNKGQIIGNAIYSLYGKVLVQVPVKAERDMKKGNFIDALMIIIHKPMVSISIEYVLIAGALIASRRIIKGTGKHK